MKDLYICNKWKISCEEDNLSDFIEVGGKRTVTHEKRIKHLSENVWCLYQALKIVGKVDSVIDLCAGIGLWAAVIEQELKPKSLHLVDLDPACCYKLATMFENYPIHNDSYWNINCKEFDLALLDVTICTAKRVFDNNPKIPLLKILKEGVEWVFISDCAAPKLHLNYKSYEKILKGSIKTYEDYIKLYSRKLFQETGKSVHTVFLSGSPKCPHSSYFLIHNKEPLDFKIKEVKNVPPTGFYKGGLWSDGE